MASRIPNTYRFFVSPDCIGETSVLLTDSNTVHHMVRVLRLRPDSRVLLLDGLGHACTVRLTEVSHNHVAGHIEQREPVATEPTLHLALYVALLRPERFEWVLQKGTELGASRFVPVVCAHSLPSKRADERKLLRWRKIVREAAEQSCRGRIPMVTEPHPFDMACQQAAAETNLALLLWAGDDNERKPVASLRSVLRPAGGCSAHPTAPTATPPTHLPDHIALCSGPEGGFADYELTAATAHGIMPVSLGSRILRAETAPIAAAAMLFYELEG